MKIRPHSAEVRQELVVPKSRRRAGGTSYTINSEVKNWLKDMTTNHWYLFEHKEHGGLWIAFHNHNEAMKFKLAWH